MVMVWKILSFFLLASVGIYAASVNIDASIDQNEGVENTPLDGIIVITHAKADRIDTASFKLGNKTISPTFVKDNVISGETIVSIYSFNLPGQSSGLYILPSLTVKVGDKTYQSVPASYEVIKAEGKSPAAATSTRAANNRYISTSSTPQGPPTLKLEAKVNGPATLYPGQKTTLFYRISYNRNIDLVESNLPFVEAKELQKIGDAHIKDYQETLYTIQEITQEVEALKPGHFQFGPSSIQGYTYTADGLGQKTYDPTLLEAKAPVIDLSVLPFPKGAPSTFNGALGAAQVSLKMTTENRVNLGGKVNLILTITGIANLIQLKLPDLACQPGFSGFFLLNDLPPAASTKGESKEFQIELTPLTTLIQEVPSIEVSSFDPANGKYIVQSTEPIPLTITESIADTIAVVGQKEVIESKPDWTKIWAAPFQIAPPLELKEHPVPSQVSFSYWNQSPWVILLIPFAMAWFIVVNKIHHYWLSRPIQIRLRSNEFLDRAFKERAKDPLPTIHLIELAFWWKLKEKGIIDTVPSSLEKLPKEGWIGKIYAFILRLQTLEYSENKGFSLDEIKAEATKLFTESVDAL